MKTLLLSASYFPIRVISWERAIKMRFEETADVVAELQAWQAATMFPKWLPAPRALIDRRSAPVEWLAFLPA